MAQIAGIAGGAERQGVRECDHIRNLEALDALDASGENARSLAVTSPLTAARPTSCRRSRREPNSLNPRDVP